MFIFFLAIIIVSTSTCATSISPENCTMDDDEFCENLNSTFNEDQRCVNYPSESLFPNMDNCTVYDQCIDTKTSVSRCCPENKDGVNDDECPNERLEFDDKTKNCIRKEDADCNKQSTTPSTTTTETTTNTPTTTTETSNTPTEPEPEPTPAPRREIECPYNETFNATERTEVCVRNPHFCCYTISEICSKVLGVFNIFPLFATLIFFIHLVVTASFYHKYWRRQVMVYMIVLSLVYFAFIDPYHPYP